MSAPKDPIKLAEFKEKCRLRQLGKTPGNKGKLGKNKGQEAWNKGLKCPQLSHASSQEEREARSKKMRGRIRITDGVNEFLIPADKEIPVGCWKGRAPLNLGREAWNKGKTLVELFGAERGAEKLEENRKNSKKAVEKTRAVPRTAEVKKKTSDTLKESWRQQKVDGTAEGRVKRASEALIGKRMKRVWTAEEKEAQRIRAIQGILEGKRHPHLNYRTRKKKFETNKAGSITTQSSWEELYAKLLDKNPFILTFTKDTIRLPYIHQEKKYTYIVDFLITYICGEQELIEIKPFNLLEESINIAKFTAARAWCAERRIEFVILTEKELFPK